MYLKKWIKINKQNNFTSHVWSIFYTGNEINQAFIPFSCLWLKNIFYKMFLIYTKELKKFKTGNGSITPTSRPLIHIWFSFKLRSSKLISKTGNGIIHSENGVIWTYMNLFGPIWTKMDPYWPFGTFLDLFGPT